MINRFSRNVRAYGMSKDLICKKGKTKCNNIIKQCKKWSNLMMLQKEPLQIPDHPYKILIVGGSGSGKTNSLFNLISYQPDIDKIYLYAENPHEAKYQLLINKQDSASLKLLLNTQMIWILFICNPVVTNWFIRGKKLNISLVFVSQSYFAVLKNIRLNSKHYLIMKIQNKQEFQQAAFNNSSDIDIIEFINLYKKCTAKPFQ